MKKARGLRARATHGFSAVAAGVRVAFIAAFLVGSWFFLLEHRSPTHRQKPSFAVGPAGGGSGGAAPQQVWFPGEDDIGGDIGGGVRGSSTLNDASAAQWATQRRHLLRQPFHKLSSSGGYEAISQELKKSVIRPDPAGVKTPPMKLRQLGIVIATISQEALDGACAHVERSLTAIMGVAVHRASRRARRGNTPHDRMDASDAPLVGRIIIAGPGTADWTPCDKLLRDANFAVELVPSAMPSYSDAVETAVTHFSNETTHILAVEARPLARVEAVVSPRFLGRLATMHTASCHLFSCVDVDAETGLVSSAGLEAVETVDGELRHFHGAHFGGFLASRLQGISAPNASTVVVPPENAPAIDSVWTYDKRSQPQQWIRSGDDSDVAAVPSRDKPSSKDVGRGPTTTSKAADEWYFNTALVRPACMMATRAALMKVAIPPRFAPTLVDGVVHPAVTDGELNGGVAGAGKVLSVAKAKQQLVAALDALESTLLRLPVTHVSSSPEAAKAFDKSLTRAMEWQSAAVDMCKENEHAMFLRSEPYTPRVTLATVGVAEAHEYLIRNTTATAFAVIKLWQAQRNEDIEMARHAPSGEASVELALRLSPSGRSCTSPTMMVPVTTTTSNNAVKDHKDDSSTTGVGLAGSSSSAGSGSGDHYSVQRSAASSTALIAVPSEEYQPFKISSYLTIRANQQLRALKPPGMPVIAWFHVCCYCCGFSNEIVHLTVVLQRRYPFMNMAAPECFCSGFNTFTGSVINRTSSNSAQYVAHRNQQEPVIWISHTTPIHYNSHLFECNPPSYFVGRSMFEFSVVPDAWLSHAAVADEIWVPSKFVYDAFLSSGFRRDRLVLVPEAIDADLFTPDRNERFALPHCTFRHLMNDSSNLASNIGFDNPLASSRAAELGQLLHSEADQYASERAPVSSNFKFLAVFKWELRKGWDILLKGFFTAFKHTDRVSLYIATSIFATEETNHRHDRDAQAVLSWVYNLTSQMGLSPHELPHIFVITANLDETEVAALYRSVDAFVLPTRGEGWGLPVMQAMASGLPTISTNYSGQLDFMLPGTCFPVRVKEFEIIPAERVGVVGASVAMKWAVPDVDHLVEQLLTVYRNPAAARAVGRRAREHIAATYSEEAVYRTFLEPNLKRIRRIIQTRPVSEQFGGRVDC